MAHPPGSVRRQALCLWRGFWLLPARFRTSLCHRPGRLSLFITCILAAAHFYEYDIALRSWKGWEKLEGIGEAPANRAGMGLALSSEKMFIFGGYRGSYLNDLVEYDINGSSWKDLSPMSAGVAPSVRANMGFEEWNGKLYLFGGQNGAERESE
eukprot:2416706-Rhodomonas_salina.1